ncbi:MAG: NAD-glutamate dehydrogenase [Woeseiaceae bacterium]|nr:NAD-glutamate dehydrogenase [Woeseiaceae bacterium]
MTRQHNRRGSDIKQSIVDKIVSSRVQSKTLSGRQQIKLFLNQYFANVPYEDLQGRSERVMARIALDHLEFANKRRKGRALLRIYNPVEETHGYASAYTFVEMVNDDMPFLVDSVSSAINGHDLAVHITVHPIIRVVRDGSGKLTKIAGANDKAGGRESFIRFAIDRETNPERLKALETGIRKVLVDVRAAVSDWKKMRRKMSESVALLENGPPGADEELRGESKKLLEWLEDENFTFLGYREHKLVTRGEKMVMQPVEGSQLGLLRVDEHRDDSLELSKEMARVTRSKNWLILNKANKRSTVHRTTYLDYVGVKIYNDRGKMIGERGFIGLLTSVAYSENPANIPLLRHKVRQVLESANIEPGAHRGKALLHIIDNFPREELFQSSVKDLARTTIGILNLQDRQRVRFFLRRDAFLRFFSCLVFVPREKYTTAVRRKIETILMDEFDGTSVESAVQISDSKLARVHLIVHTEQGKRHKVDIARVERRIADVVVTWSDRLRDELIDAYGQDDGLELYRSYGKVFPAGFQEDTSPRDACSDIQILENMVLGGDRRSVNLYRPEGSDPGHMHFMIYSADEPLPLSEALPVLEDMGVDVYTERPYEIRLGEDVTYWIQDFHLRHESGEEVDVYASAKRFEECFTQVLEGHAENDGLNRLVLSAGLDWRQTTLLRCYAKYLQQLAMPFSQSYLEDVLVDYAGLVRLLVRQFELQFDPDLAASRRKRELGKVLPAVKRAVSRATNVDEDRILTAFSGAVTATLRTSYYLQDENGRPRPYLSIKLDPAALPEAPLPLPKFEIFVYSPEVEGVHLRGGDIARGGLRWSDRREDFRTEVLGLMKAQVVKNTVIVPTGAKGGFFPKRVPDGDRDVVFQNGVKCYTMFISGLLDITDNVIDGKVVTPDRVVRRDDEDPYLVVAADKGTATFSDIANNISASYGFWLDDAFASGGSAGYDHKKMGITARGAWEAVKRHFREQGINTQKDPFTVAGIGDMSGDVFGNGMLLSRKIKLVAAFNHLDIFLDPNPDPAASYRERQRLFKLPRSGWGDYNEELISKGGGVFSRQAKTIRLSREVREILDTDKASMQPDELIRAILGMQVDLLWNGGIGTYVKASSEGHSDAGDRSNDRVRVNANELRCRVIGEGGNLGLTQRARIEYSLKCGRVNTDFIDNSAGVDSSDREVNIKILLSAVAKQKNMTRTARDKLLASMTDDVADLVLRTNYLQTQAISMSEIRSLERIDETARLIANLERTGLLDRDLEFLPDDVEIEERRARKEGLTRPELAVVLSYAKIDLYDGLIASNESLRAFLEVDPRRYFPTVLRRRYAEFIPTHHLNRQILATLIANEIVNRMGPAFVKRMQVDTAASMVTIARAYWVAKEICRAGPLLHDIEQADYEIPASAQMSMMFEVSRTLRHASYWLIENYGEKLDIVAAVERLKEPMATIYNRSSSFMSQSARDRHARAESYYRDMGVPDKLATRMSLLLLTRAALDISDLAVTHKREPIETARLYSAFNDNLGIYWLHLCAEDLKVSGRWQAIARSNLREDVYRIRRELAAQLLKRRGKQDLKTAVERWLQRRSEPVERYKLMVEEMRLRGAVDFATLSVAAQELRDLIYDRPVYDAREQ